MTEALSTRRGILQNMTNLQEALMQLPDAKVGDEACEIIHHYADGMYIREMRGKKGMLVVTKLHKTTHPFFMTEGDVTIESEKGIVRLKAPAWGITKAGTKRVAYFHEDTVWITVHATDEVDLQKIESEVIAETFDELPESVKKELLLEEV